MSDNLGGEDSELRSYPSGYDSLRFALYTCGKCGFTDYLYPLDRPVPDPEKKAIQEYLSSVPRETIERLHTYAPYSPAHHGDKDYEKNALSKYRFLLDILKMRETVSYRMATALLEAAWIADDVTDDDDAHLQAGLRREALKY